MSKAAKNKLAFFLLIPVLIFYTGYFLNYQQGYRPSGFIQYDNIGYVAFAKQYLDHPQTHLGYNNPFGDSGEHPRIYFQTQTIALQYYSAPVLIPGLHFACSVLCFVSWPSGRPFLYLPNCTRMCSTATGCYYYSSGVVEFFPFSVSSCGP